VTTEASTAQAGAEGTRWIHAHRLTWARKELLRHFYISEYFERILRAMPRGRSLEVGAGPGFFAEYHRCDVVTDVAPAPHVDQVVDVHAMPFPDESFDCVVGIDVAHHFYYPAKGLMEIARILRPSGRLILVEPWTGPLGYFVNKYLHTEDCFPIADPWAPVLTNAKNAMQGNATIPKSLFFDNAQSLVEHTGLRTLQVSPFSCLGFLSTGGFTRWSLPKVIGRAIIKLDRKVPDSLLRYLAMKVFIVAERVPAVER
jgi:SAM-dependent methyltransferase